MSGFLVNLFLKFLRLGAKIQLIKVRPKIIALTGSAGKTSLRNAIFAVLKDDFKTKKSQKANSETGLPLDILGLHLTNYSLFDWMRLFFMVPVKLITNWKHYDYYIAELGVDDPYPPKNMGYLLSFIKPDISIFLNVALVHTQQFEKIIPKNKQFSSNKKKQDFLIKAIAYEKGKIITSLSKDKIAIVNYNDPYVKEEAKNTRAKLHFFGTKLKSSSRNFRIGKYQPTLKGTTFSYFYQGKKVSFKLPYLLPEYYKETFAGAILTGLVVGLPLKKAVRSLKNNFVLPPGRMSVFKGIKHTTIIDSSYNASRQPVLGALHLLDQIKTKDKKVFIFGDMRELGSQAKIEHQRVAKKICSVVDQIILVGPLTKKYVLPVISGKIKTKWFANSWQAASFLKANLKGKETILVKGSQNTIFTEIVVEQLLSNKKDKKHLCRQSKFWQKKRNLLNN